jgi:hypothetical protein
VEIDSYNDHVRLLLRAGWLDLHHQLYSGTGADIVMESITQVCAFASPFLGSMSVIRILRQLEM